MRNARHKPEPVTLLIAGSCLLLLLIKLTLIWRININWDEFLHLSHVHEASRGETTRIFQRVFTHFFAWLPGFGANEIDEIRAGRIVAWAGLAVSAWLIAKLASRWVSPRVAWIAPLAFLAASPVLRHGASFRADSWLLPLTLLSLVLITGSRDSARRILIAGAAIGVSFAISVKAVLMAPLFAVLLLGAGGTLQQRIVDSVRFSAAAALAAGGLFLLQWLTVAAVAPGSVTGFAANAAGTTLLDAPFLPRWDYLEQTLRTDRVSWLLILGGCVVALTRARLAAWCVLSLAPLLFYRNAFPYYYVIMLAPAAVFAALVVDWLLDAAEKASSGASRSWLAAAACVPVVFQAAVNLQAHRFDNQALQALTVSAVHEIFPEPVPYIDHSGMIASFPKANFFMSSWGIAGYQARGASFMRTALESSRPPLLLANAPALMAGTPSFGQLLDDDRQLIEQYYVPYWGAISIAGARSELVTDAARTARLPFPGRYRLIAAEPVLIDGRLADAGTIVEFGEDAGSLSVVIQRTGTEPVIADLVWAEAKPAPAGFVPRFASLYESL